MKKETVDKIIKFASDVIIKAMRTCDEIPNDECLVLFVRKDYHRDYWMLKDDEYIFKDYRFGKEDE